MMQALKIRSLALTAAAATIFAAACGGDRDSAYDTTVAGGDVVGADTSATAMSGMNDLPTTDAGAIELVMTVDRAEVEAGELALTKGASAEVKEFARMMITDHGNDREKLENLRRSFRGDTTMGTSGALTTLQMEHSQTMSRLQSLSGAEFDRAYIESMVSGHEQVLNAVRQVQPRVQDAQLQQHLSEVATTVQRHLDRAREIQNRLGSTTTDTSRSG